MTLLVQRRPPDKAVHFLCTLFFCYLLTLHCATFTSGAVTPPCNSGTYTTIVNSVSVCKICPDGTYTTLAGVASSANCLGCPVGTESTTWNGYFWPRLLAARPTIQYLAATDRVYLKISSSVTWSTASSSVANNRLENVPAYLATASSAAENTFLTNLAGTTFWLAAADSVTEGVWKWTAGPDAGLQFWSGTSTGSPVGGRYTNWNSGEPNNAGTEDWLQVYSSGVWNDANADATAIYIGAWTAADLKDAIGRNACSLCPPGKYADSPGTITCKLLPKGYYSNGYGVNSTLYAGMCPAGTFSIIEGALNNSVCQQVPPGYYSNAGANASIPCPAGTYANVSGSAACTACPAGTYSTASAATSRSTCIDLPAGYYSATAGLSSIAQATRCPAGTWSSTVGANRSTTCIACPQGFFGAQLGATSSNVCSICPPGTRALTAQDRLEDFRKQIPNLQYFSGTGNVYSASAVASTWASALASAQASQLFNVSGYLVTITSSAENSFVSGLVANPFWIGANRSSGSGNWTWVAGPEKDTVFWIGNSAGNAVDGQFTNWNANAGEPSNIGGGAGDALQINSTTGLWSAAGGAITYRYIVEWTGTALMETVGRNECIVCPPGSYASTNGSTSCKLFPAGYYSALSGMNSTDSAIACPAGTFSTVSGATSATACQPVPAGFYSMQVAANSSASAIPCPPGTFSNTSGATNASVCLPCPAGTYSSSPNRTFCILAPPGGFVPQQQSTNFSSCPAGTYSDISGSSYCFEMPAGTYCAESSQNSTANALLCPAGTFSETKGATDQNSCLPLPAGFFSSVAGLNSSTLALPCPAGTFSLVLGANSSSTCEMLPAGYYSSTIGMNTSAFAHPCPAGTYSTTVGASNISFCIPCPSGTWSNKSAADSDRWCRSCPRGYFATQVGLTSPAQCSPCPLGTETIKKVQDWQMPRIHAHQPGAALFNGTGNVYVFQAIALLIEDALAAAHNLELLLTNGYLVTITSAEENDFATNLAGGAAFWASGSDLQSEGVWKWIAGPENQTQFWTGDISGSVVNGSYANWADGEPNNYGGYEPFLMVLGNGRWNDQGPAYLYYVVEWNANDLLETLGRRNCSLCKPGSYADHTGMYSCSLSPAGLYLSGEGATSLTNATACPSGYWSSTEGATDFSTCNPLPAGYFSNISGASSFDVAIPCPQGTFSTAVGSNSSVFCMPCPAGKFSTAIAANQSEACIDCPAGTFASDEGTVACSPLPAGMFSNISGATNVSRASRCPLGTFSVILGATNSSVCQPVPSGYYCPHAGCNGSSITACPAGYIATGPGGSNFTAACRPCAAGFYFSANVANGTTTCQPCPAGTASLTVAAISPSTCKICANGTFAASGSSNCSVCPQGFTSAAPFAECAQCRTGHFGNFCLPCLSACENGGFCRDGRTGNGACACPSTHSGTTCTECATDLYNYPSCNKHCHAVRTCFGNGRCSNEGACLCNSGWMGVNCSERIPIKVSPPTGIEPPSEAVPSEVGDTVASSAVAVSVVGGPAMVFLIGSMDLLTRLSYMSLWYPLWFVRFSEGMMMPLSSWVFPILENLDIGSALDYPPEERDDATDPNLKIAAMDMTGTYAAFATQSFVALGTSFLVIAVAQFLLTPVVVASVAFVLRRTRWKRQNLLKFEMSEREAELKKHSRWMFASLYFIIYTSGIQPLTICMVTQFFSSFDRRPLLETIVLSVVYAFYMSCNIFLWPKAIRAARAQKQDLRSSGFAFSGTRDNRIYYPFLAMSFTFCDAVLVTPGLMQRLVSPETQVILVLTLAFIRLAALLTLRPHRERLDMFVELLIHGSDIIHLCLVLSTHDADNRSETSNLGGMCLIISVSQTVVVLIVTVIGLVGTITSYSQALWKVLLYLFSKPKRQVSGWHKTGTNRFLVVPYDEEVAKNPLKLAATIVPTPVHPAVRPTTKKKFAEVHPLPNPAKLAQQETSVKQTMLSSVRHQPPLPEEDFEERLRMLRARAAEERLSGNSPLQQAVRANRLAAVLNFMGVAPSSQLKPTR